MPSFLRSGRVRRATLLVLCMAVLLGLLCLAAAWVVPWAVKAQLEQRGSAALGRSVTVERVDFRPWSLELSLHDLAIASATGTAPQAEIKRIYIDAAWRSLGRWAPVVDALEIDAPVMRVTRTADGRSDIDDLIRRVLPDAAPAEPASPREPARFALYNISVRDGAIEWTDEVAGRVQSVQALEIAVPFLSTLAVHRDILVKPRLAFLLNGSAFETTAEATPFAAPHRAAVRLQVRQLDLAPFAAHAQGGLPLRLQSGRLDADLRLAFEQAEQPSATLTGEVTIHEGQMLDGQAREVIGFDALRLRLQDVQPLQRKVLLESIESEGLRAELRRAADGRLEWPSPSRPAPSSPSPAQDGAAWTVAVQRVAVANGRIGWTDRSVDGPRWEARHVQLQASDLNWPLQRPVRFRASADLPGKEARLALAGEARSGAAQAAVSVAGLPLESAAPYLRSYLRPRLSGTVDADLGLAWKGPAMVARVARLAVNGLTLDCGTGASVAAAAPCASGATAGGSSSAPGRQVKVRRLEATDAWVRWPQRTASVGSLKVTEPRAAVSRDAQGRWMFEAWRQPAASTGSAAPGGDALQAPAAAPWQLRIDDAAVEGGALAFRDEAAAGGPVSVQLSSLQMRVRGLSPLPAPGADAAAPSPLSLAARVGSGRFEPGRLNYDGTLRLRPLELQGKLQASHLPLQALEPYAADRLNVRIARAEGSFAGDVRHAQGTAGVSATALQGDLSIDEVRVLERGAASCAGPRDASPDGEEPCGSASADDLLRWKALGLRGLRLETAAGKPWSLQVRETALSDFFARVVLQENGRLNLQDLLKPIPVSANGGSARQDVPKEPPADAAAAAPRIRFGPITLAGGSVAFSDRFVKPNYSTDLSELAGRLGAFASASASAPGEAPQMADLELRGKAEGTASVEISGQLNPLAQPLALDIQGRMRDLELPPLSPYSVKYAGHAIERGKLAVDVNYRVQPDGQLTASNRVVLRQLAFGDAVEGAPASLPVRLAAALLADRDGVIDVDLPISGSLNDPEFRLGSVIWRVLGNMVLKAVTSPFSLLAGAFGGSEELDRIEFAPGSAALDAASRERLDKIARALADRPALTLTVVGEAAPEADREGWKRQRLHDMVLAEKRRAVARAGLGAEAAAAAGAPVAISPDEYNGLLKEVYRRADMPKPRNLIGLAKDLPAGDMERLLLAHIAVPADAMRALAVARGAAARDYLAQHAVPLDRLFVGAPRADAGGDAWTPRASMTLQAR